jgi:hypothetical protein
MTQKKTDKRKNQMTHKDRVQLSMARRFTSTYTTNIIHFSLVIWFCTASNGSTSSPLSGIGEKKTDKRKNQMTREKRMLLVVLHR